MQYSIIKKGRRGYIRPLPPLSLSKTLECRLSYTKQGAQFMPNPLWANVKLYLIKSGSFPWGLLDQILEVCETWSDFKDDTFKVIVLKKEQIVPKISDKLRDYQKDAVKQLCINHGGIISMPTGSGKTFTAISFIEQIKKKTLVICPTCYLVEQWQQQVPNYVDVRTYQGIKNYDILMKYDVVLFDECHHVAASTLYKLAMKLNEQIVVGLSATPNREDGEDMKIFGALGKIVYDISLRELINQNFLCDAEVSWVDLKPYIPDFFDENYQDYYKNAIVENDERNEAIINHVKFNPIKKILILVGQIDHGEKLFQMLKDDDVVFIYSKTKNIDVDHRIIIATSIFDEGVDLPDREVIIMAAGGKSSIKCTQRIGRVLRLHLGKDKALIVDFIDRAKYLNKHYQERKRLYQEYGFDREDL